MAPVTNRPERFAAGVAAGRSATASYVVAGGRASRATVGSCSFDGVDDRDRRRSAARRHRHARRRSVPSPEGELWVHELDRLRRAAIRTARCSVRSSRCEDNPAHDLLVLDAGALDPDGVRHRTRRRGVVVVDLPDGLLDCRGEVSAVAVSNVSKLRIDVFTILPEYLDGAARTCRSSAAARARGTARRARARSARRTPPIGIAASTTRRSAVGRAW